MEESKGSEEMKKGRKEEKRKEERKEGRKYRKS
jgi:hypothetical protein